MYLKVFTFPFFFRNYLCAIVTKILLIKVTPNSGVLLSKINFNRLYCYNKIVYSNLQNV